MKDYSIEKQAHYSRLSMKRVAAGVRESIAGLALFGGGVFGGTVALSNGRHGWAAASLLAGAAFSGAEGVAAKRNFQEASLLHHESIAVATARVLNEGLTTPEEISAIARTSMQGSISQMPLPETTPEHS